jgi:hypothetical protein
MMVGGIVMTALAPVALLVAAAANNEQTYCELGIGDFDDDAFGVDDNVDSCDDYDKTIYGGLISAAVLAGVGIPLIVIGAKKEPVTARIMPWATAKSAGFGLRVDM